MFSYNRIRQISEMFDPSIHTNVSLYDHMVDFEDDIDWTYQALSLPISEFYATTEQFDFTRIDDEPLSPQNQIRNHDCMWSGRCTTHPNECLGTRNNCNTKYLNENDMKKSVNGNGGGAQQQQPTYSHQQQNAIDCSLAVHQHQQQQQSLQQVTPSALHTNLIQFNQQKKQQQQPLQQQNIPPGRSLLRLNHVKPAVIKLPNVSTNDFLKDRDFIARPDTPLSLDDDPPEFKHTIDLAACTMGSNKMSLISESPTEIINILKEHLEDVTSNRVPNKMCSYMSSIRADGLDELMKDIKSFSDFEDGFDDDDDDDADADESDATNDSFNISSTMVSLASQSPPSLSSPPSSSMTPPTSSNNGNSNNNNSTSTTTYENTQSMHSDHSYTRSKSRVDVIGLGVQTPSDSEEEIDVVSVSDKNLPTNPSAKDRRALQTTVAHKITSRMVKTSTGIRTIPPRRRISNVSSDSSAYSSKCSSEATSNVSTLNRSASTPTNASRKRVATTIGSNQTAKRSKISKKVSNQISTGVSSNSSCNHNTSSNSASLANASRLSPGGQSNITQESLVNGSSGATSSARRQPPTEINEEIETIEKRNLHNDMERQRRIGLKNLFENLKEKIPSLQEKDRAPKVNILREATILCNKLSQDDAEYEALMRRKQRLQQRLKQLRTEMAATRGIYI